jgi:hypothetical protein
MRLLLSATTIDSALSYIRTKQQQEQHLSLDSTDGNNIDDSDSQLSKEGRQRVF